MSTYTLSAVVAVALGLAATASGARADDLADCNAGIDFIKAEIAKKPADPVMKKLLKAQKDAKRELGEGEFDECLDAVKDAHKAVGK